MIHLVKRQRGFTLIELLIVIAIIGILGSVLVSKLMNAKEKAYMSRSKAEFMTMYNALSQYYLDNGVYPADANRNIPPGLEPYLAGYQLGTWPGAPWPNSVYDWENWTDTNGSKIYQISIRFCPSGSSQLSACTFPNEPWASGFGVNSAVYYCVEGACRAHLSEPPTYPGYCVNC